MTTLKDEIQEETRSQKRTSVILSSITATGSIVVIGAVVASPFTARQSIALTPYGGSTMMISMFLNNFLVGRKESRVLKKLVYAEEKVFLYSFTCLKFYQYLLIDNDLLQTNIDILKQLHPGSTNNFMDFLTFFGTIMHIDANGFKKLLSTDQKLKFMEYLKPLESLVCPETMKHLTPTLNMMKGLFALYGELTTLYSSMQSLISNLDDLDDFEKGRKCIEATRIDHIIKTIQRQFEDYYTLFK